MVGTANVREQREEGGEGRGGEGRGGEGRGGEGRDQEVTVTLLSLRRPYWQMLLVTFSFIPRRSFSCIYIYIYMYGNTNLPIAILYVGLVRIA